MAWINSGIRRLEKEHRATRNKQFAKLKENETADDSTVESLATTVASNTASIGVLEDAEVKSLAIEGTAAWWSTNTTFTPYLVNTAHINMRNAQILEVRCEMWETGQANLTPSDIASPGVAIFLGLSGNTVSGGHLAELSFLGLNNTAGTGVAVRTAYTVCATKTAGDSNFNPNTALIPLQISSTGAWPTSNTNWKLRLQITYVALPGYVYA